MTEELDSELCLECGENRATHTDPRCPPLDTEPCVCLDCLQWICEDLMDEAEDETGYWRDELAKVQDEISNRSNP